MGKYAMAVDLEKCIGCGACIVACKAENRVPPDVFRLTVYELEQGTFPGRTTKNILLPGWILWE